MSPVKPDDFNKPTAVLMNGVDITQIVGHLNFAKSRYQWYMDHPEDSKFAEADLTAMIENVDYLKARLLA